MKHIDVPSDERMRQLAAHRHPGSVSIYLSTGVGPDDGRRARSDLTGARDRVAGILTQLAPEEVDAVTTALDELAEDIGSSKSSPAHWPSSSAESTSRRTGSRTACPRR